VDQRRKALVPGRAKNSARCWCGFPVGESAPVLSRGVWKSFGGARGQNGGARLLKDREAFAGRLVLT
jgi:hypothetical protein